MNGKILALDYGERSIGIAISDETGKIAFPRGSIKNNKNAASEIKRICEEEDVQTIVIGAPFTATGQRSRQHQRVERFVNHLEGTLHIPIVFQDERFSTEEARAFLKKRHTRTDLDAISAALILEAYLKLR